MVESKVPKAEETEEKAQAASVASEEAQILPSTREEITTPLTREEFAASLEQLSARARAAGLRPLQMMLAAYAKQGMAMLEGLLGALDEGGPKKPPITKAPDSPTEKKG